MVKSAVMLWLQTGCFLAKLESRAWERLVLTYVSNENNLGSSDEIRYIWGLKGPIFIL